MDRQEGVRYSHDAKENVVSVKLFLDDIREAPDATWVVVRNILDAKLLLEEGIVLDASLDHDLGACVDCVAAYGNNEQWLERTEYREMPHCDHVGTGYTLVCWMEETGFWPRNKPTVHSANPAGKAKMIAAINKHYGAFPV